MVHSIIKHRTYFLLGILFIIIYFPIFLHMDYMPIRMWDESILGVSAIEMGQNHNYIVPYTFGHPDLWNCKPPLAIWSILFFSKLFGFNELALRFPSALAALILCLYLFFSLRKYTGSLVYGFMVVCILITCQGYARNHVIRTGEYDSLLVLFSTIFSIHLFLATEATRKEEQSKHLFLFFFFLTLAVLTKGIACMMLAPGLFVYVLAKKKILPILKDKWFYAGLTTFITFGIGYYFLRESINPGYLRAVWENELGGRFATTNEGHSGNILFYLNEIISRQFTYYILLFPAAVIVGLKFSESKISRVVLFALVTGIFFLGVISFSATKLPHYDAPLFPFLAIISASLFFLIFIGIRNKLLETRNYFISSIVAFFCCLTFFISPYNEIITKVYFPKGDWWEEGFSRSCRIFQDAVRGKIKIDAYKLVFDPNEYYEPKNVLRCYQQELIENKITAQIVNSNAVTNNDTAVVFENSVKQLIEQKFEITTVRHIDAYNADVIVCRERAE